MLSVKECADLIADEYPSFYVSSFIQYDDRYFFTIVPKGRTPRKALFDLHEVDRETGSVSGTIPMIAFLQQPNAVNDVENARYLGMWSIYMNIRRFFIKSYKTRH